MPRFRRDPGAKGLIHERFWRWLQSGTPKTPESEYGQWPAAEWWLVYMFTGHWHPCYGCGESVPERLLRLLHVAIAEGIVRLADGDELLLDDDNTKAVIRALDELEVPPDWAWWRSHYESCPGRLAQIEQLHDSTRKGEAKL
jgi:hypothetical protein